MTLGTRLKNLREKLNISQLRVAQALGISNVQLSRYESDERKPDPDTIKILAEFYETSTDYLLGLTNDPSSNTEQTKSTELFPTRLRQLREKKHISISDLAKQISRTESYIEKLESVSSQLPGQDVLNSLSEIFDVTRDYLCGYTDDPQGYGTSLYDNDPKDLVEMIQTQGPVMFDGETIESDEDKAKMIELMRLAYAMVKQQNKDIAAKRGKKGSKGESD